METFTKFLTRISLILAFTTLMGWFAAAVFAWLYIGEMFKKDKNP